MPKFKVGDWVWWAKCRWEPIQIPCPTCFGKKQVTLILGNGDEVILPCHGCAPGFESARGYIEEYDYISEPEQIYITGMDIKVDGDKEKVQYRGPYIYDEEDLFSEQIEALAKSQEKKRQLDEDQQTRTEHIKKNVHKSFSWNARYHIREAGNHREKAEYHDKMAVVCKSKSKQELTKDGEK